jgi:hypothetical protein
MNPKTVPLWCLIATPSKLPRQTVERIVGEPDSDQSLAFWLRWALKPPLKFAKTPAERKSMKTEFQKAVHKIAEAANNHDEAFFEKWARGRKELKAIDPRTSLDPGNFLLAAHGYCTAGGRQTSQTEVIRMAIDFLAQAHINGFPNRVPFPSQRPTREQLDAVISQRGLRTIGWKAYIRKLGITFPDKAKRGRKKGWRKK